MVLHDVLMTLKMKPSQQTEVVAAGILNLGSQIEDNLPRTEVCISGIPVRKDKRLLFKIR